MYVLRHDHVPGEQQSAALNRRTDVMESFVCIYCVMVAFQANSSLPPPIYCQSAVMESYVYIHIHVIMIAVFQANSTYPRPVAHH